MDYNEEDRKLIDNEIIKVLFEYYYVINPKTFFDKIMEDEYLSNEEKASLLRDYISKYSKFFIGDRVLDIPDYNLISDYNLNDDYIDELVNILIYEQNNNPNLITLNEIFNGDKIYVLKINNSVMKVYENEEIDKSIGFNILKE